MELLGVVGRALVGATDEGENPVEGDPSGDEAPGGRLQGELVVAGRDEQEVGLVAEHLQCLLPNADRAVAHASEVQHRGGLLRVPEALGDEEGDAAGLGTGGGGRAAEALDAALVEAQECGLRRANIVRSSCGSPPTLHLLKRDSKPSCSPGYHFGRTRSSTPWPSSMPLLLPFQRSGRTVQSVVWEPPIELNATSRIRCL